MATMKEVVGKIEKVLANWHSFVAPEEQIRGHLVEFVRAAHDEVTKLTGDLAQLRAAYEQAVGPVVPAADPAGAPLGEEDTQPGAAATAPKKPGLLKRIMGNKGDAPAGDKINES